MFEKVQWDLPIPMKKMGAVSELLSSTETFQNHWKWSGNTKTMKNINLVCLVFLPGSFRGSRFGLQLFWQADQGGARAEVFGCNSWVRSCGQVNRFEKYGQSVCRPIDRTSSIGRYGKSVKAWNNAFGSLSLLFWKILVPPGSSKTATESILA